MLRVACCSHIWLVGRRGRCLLCSLSMDECSRCLCHSSFLPVFITARKKVVKSSRQLEDLWQTHLGVRTSIRTEARTYSTVYGNVQLQVELHCTCTDSWWYLYLYECHLLYLYSMHVVSYFVLACFYSLFVSNDRYVFLLFTKKSFK